MTIDISLLPALQDNYIFLLHSDQSGETAVVDPAEPQPVLEALKQHGWQLTHIFNTHHHQDHVGGNSTLKAAYQCRVYGAASDHHRIPGIDVDLSEGNRITFGNQTIEVLAVPGHTSGHIAFWLPQSKALFCGDTLFSLGCGRLFEGTAEEMWYSLEKLKNLPPETRVYCAHEYTENNGNFALTVDSENPLLLKRIEEVRRLRQQNKFTIPSTIGLERQTNPFLRVDSKAIRETLKMETADSRDVFKKLRTTKDNF